MQAAGIIAEYNPFHNGHQWHIQEARKRSGCEYIIGVISGNFTQRGEPAIFDKWKRAEMAVRGGADIVIELPVAFAVRSAQHFASGGVRLLAALGVVSHICFGAEHADPSTLNMVAAAIDNPAITPLFQQFSKSGHTYAAALSKAVHLSTGVSQAVLSQPNNILAVEYLRAIRKFAPNLKPVVITREQAGYHDPAISGPFASATAIRTALLQDTPAVVREAVPQSSYTLIEQLTDSYRGPSAATKLDNILLARLRTASLADIEQLPDISEGLHYKLQKAALQAGSRAELLTLVKSRRYTYTRLQRIFTHALLGTTRQELDQFDDFGSRYARLLAFNSRGRELLKKIRSNSSIPVITKTTQYLNSTARARHDLSSIQQMLALDTLATDIYTLSLPAPWNTGGWDFRHPPYYFSE